MTIVPTFSSACELAHKMPDLIAAFIDLEQAVQRRFREDTLSDLFIATLLQLPCGKVAVRTPSERRTGSDFDLSLVDLTNNTSCHYRIQAKRLSPNPTNWKTSSYKQLAHKNGTGTQVQTLCKLTNLAGPPQLNPLYAFYNPASVASVAGVPGIALADAFEVEGLVTDALGSTPRPPFKRITELQSLFFPLSTILCPPVDDAARGIATPRQSLEAFRRLREDKPKSVLAVMKSRPTPNLVEETPSEMKVALAGAEARRIQPADIPRPQIILDASSPQPSADSE